MPTGLLPTQMVLVSAGFDAARGDPLGDCCVSAAGFGMMTRSLMQHADGKLLLALEGGYSLEQVASPYMHACRGAAAGSIGMPVGANHAPHYCILRVPEVVCEPPQPAPQVPLCTAACLRALLGDRATEEEDAAFSSSELCRYYLHNVLAPL